MSVRRELEPVYRLQVVGEVFRVPTKMIMYKKQDL